MTMAQMELAMGCSERTLRRALAGLREANLICTGALLPEGYSIDEEAKPKKVISLNRDGVEYVEHFGCSQALFDRKPIARAWDGKVIQDDEVRHKLGMVDCMIALCKFVDKFKGLEVVYMAPDFVTDDDSKSINKEMYKGGALIPDIVVSVLNKNFGNTRDFYIEFDRGTEPVWLSSDAKARARKTASKFKKSGRSRLSVPISDRFANYNQLFSEPDRATSAANPSILWVCEADDALRRIRASERIKWAGMTNIAQRTFLATIDDVKGAFLGAHWRLPDSDEIVSPLHLEKLEKAS